MKFKPTKKRSFSKKKMWEENSANPFYYYKDYLLSNILMETNKQTNKIAHASGIRAYSATAYQCIWIDGFG